MGAQPAGPPVVGETTFDAFYRDHRERLIATVNAATRCGADLATDAVDEAFVRALTKWARVERMEAPAGWVFTVARNVVHKTRGRRTIESDLARTATGVSTSGQGHGPAVAAESQWELWDAVAALAERERTAVALRYLGDLTEAQVGEVMGIAPGTVAATLHAARKHLAATLSAAEPADDGSGGTPSSVAAPTTDDSTQGGSR
jgi:RNA polymerase sigma factor (sigma-70 family)